MRLVCDRSPSLKHFTGGGEVTRAASDNSTDRWHQAPREMTLIPLRRSAFGEIRVPKGKYRCAESSNQEAVQNLHCSLMFGQKRISDPIEQPQCVAR